MNRYSPAASVAETVPGDTPRSGDRSRAIKRCHAEGIVRFSIAHPIGTHVSLEKEEIELTSLGAVGDICLHYYDRHGEPVLDEDEDPVISITLSQLKACPTVVALAGGQHKVEAISGVLAGGYLDVLITDCVTAGALADRSPDVLSR